MIWFILQTKNITSRSQIGSYKRKFQIIIVAKSLDQLVADTKIREALKKVYLIYIYENESYIYIYILLSNNN